jgi:phage antirepressor YoqD-like protein
MAQKRYTFIRVYRSTEEVLNKRINKVNGDLKCMGINKKVPKIQFMDEVAKRLTYISDRDLIKMTNRRKNKLC